MGETLASAILSARDKEQLTPRLSRLGEVGRRVVPITRGIFALEFSNYRRDWTLDVDVRSRVHDGFDAEVAVHSEQALEARYRAFQDSKGLWTLGLRLEGLCDDGRLEHELRRQLARISIPRKGLELYIVQLSAPSDTGTFTYRLAASSAYEAANKAVKGHFGGASLWVPSLPDSDSGEGRVVAMVPNGAGGFAPRPLDDTVHLAVRCHTLHHSRQQTNGNSQRRSQDHSAVRSPLLVH